MQDGHHDPSSREPNVAPDHRPAVVLVDPQLGENIGACARAMLNCGLVDLRLVRPRDGWPNERARAAATGAAQVVEAATVHERLEQALADVGLVLATSARPRDLYQPVISPQEAARQLHAERLTEPPRRGALVFGCERTGLPNGDLALAHAVVRVPLNPEFTSLNLAQAVLLLAWEWHRGEAEELARRQQGDREADLQHSLASSEELVNLYEHLEQELDASRFFRVPEKRAGMVRTLRAMLGRARMTSDEVRTLHGMISSLVGHRKDGSPVRRVASRGASD